MSKPKKTVRQIGTMLDKKAKTLTKNYPRNVIKQATEFNKYYVGLKKKYKF